MQTDVFGNEALHTNTQKKGGAREAPTYRGGVSPRLAHERDICEITLGHVPHDLEDQLPRESPQKVNREAAEWFKTNDECT